MKDHEGGGVLGGGGLIVEVFAVKSFRKELWFDVGGRRGFVNITGEVQRAIEEAGVREGLVLVNAMHITASVFINDDEGGSGTVADSTKRERAWHGWHWNLRRPT